MDTLDRYLDWYRHDPREQIAHTLLHFFGALRWVHVLPLREARARRGARRLRGPGDYAAAGIVRASSRVIMWTIRTQLNVKTLKPVRVTFVCPCRGCRRAHSVMLMRFTDRRTDSRWPATPSFWDGAGNRVEFDRIAPTCPEHQRPLRGREVEGVHRESVKCDARCTSARGHSCECSCGGRNHGASHAL